MSDNIHTHTNKTLKAGLDVGSTTAKAVVLNDENKLVYSFYGRHHADIDVTVGKILTDIRTRLGDVSLKFCVTGSAGLGIAEASGLPFVQEVIASSAFVNVFNTEVAMLIDIGGEDSKAIFFDINGRQDHRMNGNCAGGTGSFIDQMASLMNIKVSELDKLATRSSHIYPIASRCGVFAKTDVQNLLSKNIPKEDIAASVFHAVSLQVVNTLIKADTVKPKVLFCGGPLNFSSSLRKSLANSLNTDQNDIVIPDNPELVPAIGAALSANDKGGLHKVSEIIEILHKRKWKTNFDTVNHNALFEDSNEFESWKEKKEQSKVKAISLDEINETVYLGVDSGSTTTKLVLSNANGEIAFKFYTNNHGDPIGAVKLGLTKLKEDAERAGVRLKIGRTAVTGYGEDLIKTAFNIDDGLVETMAHYRSALSFNPKVSFILDIGGQDMKAIFVKDGVISNVEINEACSSGCGTFMETFANSLNYSISDFADKACNSKNPYELGSRCTVFMNSKVKQCLREGVDVEDISAGLAFSIIKNCFVKVLKISDFSVLGDNIVVQGGTFKNLSVLRATEVFLGRDVIRPEISELMGAYGCALIAAENHKNDSGNNILDEIDGVNDDDTSVILCKACENNCRLKKITFSNNKVFYTGNRCENVFSNNGGNVNKGVNLFKIKHDLLFNRNMKPSGKPLLRIGIPRVLNMFENFPFWSALFTNSGIEVVLSGPSTALVLEKGNSTIMSENICLPAKLVHGHILELIEQKVDRIFYPLVRYEEDEFEDAINSFNCPVVTGYPDVIKGTIDPEIYGIAYDIPTVSFNDIGLLKKASVHYLKQLGVDAKTIESAFSLAVDSFNNFKKKVREEGSKIIAKAKKENKLLIVLAGRPYHLDPMINQNIPDIISDFGIDVITKDAIGTDEVKKLENVEVLSQWGYSNRLYHVANWTGKNSNARLIHLNSFGCGPDAITMDEVKDILQQYGKTSTLIRIDEIISTGSVKLRIRSMIESIKAGGDINEKHSFSKRIVSPPFLESDKHKKVIAPNFSPFFSLFVNSLFKPTGLDMEILPLPDRQSVETGLKYVNNDVCYPAIIIIGDILKALQSGKYDPENTIAAITETGGQCRASNYVPLLKKALVRAGFDKVSVVAVSGNTSSINHQPGYKIKPLSFMSLAISSMLFIDALVKLHYTTLSRAKRASDVQDVTDKYMDLAMKKMGRYGVKNSISLLKEAVKDYNAIDVYDKGDMPIVGIVGEIYMKFNPYGNNFIAEWLTNRETVVNLPSLNTFFLESLVDVDYNHKAKVEKSSWFKLKGFRLIENVVDKKIDKINAIFNDFNFPVSPIVKIRELSQRAEKVLSLINQYGEGWMLPGEIAMMAEEGINDIVCVQPFGCIANHVIAKGVSKRLKEQFPDLNILFLDMDADASEVNTLNRLELFVNNISEVKI